MAEIVPYPPDPSTNELFDFLTTFDISKVWSSDGKKMYTPDGKKYKISKKGTPEDG